MCRGCETASAVKLGLRLKTGCSKLIVMQQRRSATSVLATTGHTLEAHLLLAGKGCAAAGHGGIAKRVLAGHRHTAPLLGGSQGGGLHAGIGPTLEGSRVGLS